MLFDFLCRISPRRSENYPNPEEPEEEDEDVQTERVKTVSGLTTSSLHEVKTSDSTPDEVMG